MKKKKIIILGVIAIALISVSGAFALNGYFGGGGDNAIPEDTMTRGLVASWDFDEGKGDIAYDATTNNNHGNFPHTGPGLKFEGTDDYVNCGNHNDLNITAAITIEAWVKTSIFNQHQSVVEKNFAEGFELLATRNTIGAPYVNAKIGGTYYGYLLEGNPLTANVWAHLVFTYDGGTVRLYQDGVETDSNATPSGAIATNNDNFYIGGRGGLSQHFNGSIDEVRIYNRALSAGEVNEHYHGIFSDDTGRVGYWPFDEGEGDVVDNSGSCGANCDGDLDGYTPAQQVAGYGDTHATGWTTLAASLPNFAPSWTNGKEAGGLEFDGKDDYVNCGNDSSLDITDAITIEAWVKLNSDYTSIQAIVSNYIQPSGGNNYALEFGRTDNEFTWLQNGQTVDSISSVSLSDNDWHHIVVVRSGSTGNWDISWYFDGVFDETDNTVVNPGVSPLHTTIGRQGNFDGSYFNGSIDGVKIYNRALSAEEVRYHYNRGGPVAHWKFDEGSGSTVYNSAMLISDINMNHGTIYGTTGTADAGGAASTLVDATKAWTTNEWAGETVEITAGIGSGQTRTVASNTATIITVSAVWTDDPDATSVYRVTSKDEWTTGKHKTGLSFDGIDDYVDVGDTSETSVKTISFWLKADDITSRDVIDLNILDYIEINASSVITATGFTGVVYIDAVLASTIDTNWHHITITTDTGQNASDLDIGRRDGGTYFDGKIDDVRLYTYVRSADEIRLDYNAGFAARFGGLTSHSSGGQTSTLCARDPASCMDYGLVGHWNMDEAGGDTLYDQSDNGNDGTLGSGAGADTSDPKWTSGGGDPLSASGRERASSGALSFDGKDDYVNCGNDASLNFGDTFTVETWVKPRAWTYSGIVTKNGNHANKWALGVYVDRFYFVNAYTGSSASIYGGTLNKWNHLVVVLNGTSFKGYINGVKVSDKTLAVSTGNNSHSIQIGRWYNGGSATWKYFNGSIDGVKIYNRALSAEEVRYHYNRGGPVAHWKFDEGSGQYARDSVGTADAQLGVNASSSGDSNDPTWSRP